MPREPIDAATRKAIEDRNLFDMELYEYANDLLDEQIRGVGPSFQRELSHFRRLNFAYGALHRFVPRLRRVIFDRSVPPGA
jgi:hypothetical protein